jgi:hypothetical protein
MSTAIKERGLLMSGPLVCATLDDLKGETRRLRGLEEINANPDAITLTRVGELDIYVKPKYRGRFGAYFHREVDRELQVWPVVCPYGRPGDRLYIKETWRPSIHHACTPDRQHCECFDIEVYYDADDSLAVFPESEVADGWNFPKAAHRGNVSPLFMPRWASRLLLEMKDIRIERLQQITHKAAVAEGFSTPKGGWNSLWGPRLPLMSYAVNRFANTWDKLNGETYPWTSNPWVWVLPFKRVEATQ